MFGCFTGEPLIFCVHAISHMNPFDRVAKELFGDRTEVGEFGPDTSNNYEIKGDGMSVSQYRVLQTSEPPRSGDPWSATIAPQYEHLYECLEQVQDEWPSAEIVLEGFLSRPEEWWIDNAYIFYSDIDNTQAFEDWITLAFDSSLTGSKGNISPDDLQVTESDGQSRNPKKDNRLLASVSNFDFIEDDTRGNYVLLWWD